MTFSVDVTLKPVSFVPNVAAQTPQATAAAVRFGLFPARTPTRVNVRRVLTYAAMVTQNSAGAISGSMTDYRTWVLPVLLTCVVLRTLRLILLTVVYNRTSVNLRLA